MKLKHESVTRVLLGPQISEKATHLGEAHNQVVFRVRRDADKPRVRRAVEKLFDVKVEDVQIVNVRGKSKRFGQRAGTLSDWKKAYVRLAPGSSISFMGEKA